MTPQEHDVLALDDEQPHHTRTKEALIRERLRVTPTRFYQIRNRLLTDPEALAAFPSLSRRVEETRSQSLRAMLGRAAE